MPLLPSGTPGHPEVGHTPGVETTTGPLGQGVAMAVGFALAERRLREEFGAEVCDHRTWVFAGDGCLMEGVGQEACSLAGHLGLGHLNLIYDMNSITIDGSTDLAFSDDTAARFAAIGFGAPTKAGTAGIHGSKLGADEAKAAKAQLGLPEVPFDIPKEHLEAWREIGRRGATTHSQWRQRLETQPVDLMQEYSRRMAGRSPVALSGAIEAAIDGWTADPVNVATRKASQMALEVLTQAMPELIGGSADLSGSNLTSTSATSAVFSAAQSGRYNHYGVREFAGDTGPARVSTGRRDRDHGGL